MIALVLGGAASLWGEVEAALALGQFDGVVGCNAAGRYWPGRLGAWCSVHPEKFGPWQQGRVRDGLPPHARTFGPDDTKVNFPYLTIFGSSGLFALKVTLVDLGYDRAVLCGIPMDPSPHFDGSKPWTEATRYRQGWLDAMSHIRARTRSMGGWTAELLGRPTEDWINGN